MRLIIGGCRRDRQRQALSFGKGWKILNELVIKALIPTPYDMLCSPSPGVTLHPR